MDGSRGEPEHLYEYVYEYDYEYDDDTVVSSRHGTPPQQPVRRRQPQQQQQQQQSSRRRPLPSINGRASSDDGSAGLGYRAPVPPQRNAASNRGRAVGSQNLKAEQKETLFMEEEAADYEYVYTYEYEDEEAPARPPSRSLPRKSGKRYPNSDNARRRGPLPAFQRQQRQQDDECVNDPAKDSHFQYVYNEEEEEPAEEEEQYKTRRDDVNSKTQASPHTHPRQYQPRISQQHQQQQPQQQLQHLLEAGSGDRIIAGWLLKRKAKRGKKFVSGGWKRRYCVLRHTGVHYYKSDKCRTELGVLGPLLIRKVDWAPAQRVLLIELRDGTLYQFKQEGVHHFKDENVIDWYKEICRLKSALEKSDGVAVPAHQKQRRIVIDHPGDLPSTNGGKFRTASESPPVSPRTRQYHHHQQHHHQQQQRQAAARQQYARSRSSSVPSRLIEVKKGGQPAARNKRPSKKPPRRPGDPRASASKVQLPL